MLVACPSLANYVGYVPCVNLSMPGVVFTPPQHTLVTLESGFLQGLKMMQEATLEVDMAT